MSTPFDDTEDAIWQMLSAKSDFAALFPVNTPHQIRYTTAKSHAQDPDIQEPTAAHYPICRVILASWQPHTQSDSTGSTLDATFAIEVCSGEQYQSAIRAASWAIYRAMLGWETYVKDVVKWQSTACIYDVNAEKIDFTDQNQARNRGTEQWIAVWATRVSYHFSTAELKAH